MDRLERSSERIEQKFSWMRVIPLLAISSVLGGCVISPLDGEKFESILDPVPIRVLTSDKNSELSLRCYQATAAGEPVAGTRSGIIASFVPNDTELTDSSGTIAYLAQEDVRIPDSCWRYEPSVTDPDQYDMVTVLALEQNGSDQFIYTFDEQGMECLNESFGYGTEDISWTRWMNNDCNRGGMSNPTRTLHIRTRVPPQVSLCPYFSKRDVQISARSFAPGVTVGSIVRVNRSATDSARSCWTDTYLFTDSDGNILIHSSSLFTYQQNRERRDCALFFDECAEFNRANQQSWNYYD